MAVMAVMAELPFLLQAAKLKMGRLNRGTL